MNFTDQELAVILAALDSHLYWQLSDDDERDSGYVMTHYDDMTDEQRAVVDLMQRIEHE